MQKSIYIADPDTFSCNRLHNIIPYEQLSLSYSGQTQNGIQALSHIKVDPPDILLLNIKMPFIDGLHICEYIHVHKIPTKVILMFGQGDLANTGEALHFGVTHYLPKPIEENNLIRLIKDCMVELFRSDQSHHVQNFHQQHQSYISSLLKGEEVVWNNPSHCPHGDWNVLLGIYAPTGSLCNTFLNYIRELPYYCQIFTCQSPIIYVGMLIMHAEYYDHLQSDVMSSLVKLRLPYYYTLSPPFNIHHKKQWSVQAQFIRDQLKNRYFVPLGHFIPSTSDLPQNHTRHIEKTFAHKIPKHMTIIPYDQVSNLFKRVHEMKNYILLEYLLLQLYSAVHIHQNLDESNAHDVVNLLLNSNHSLEDLKDAFILELQAQLVKQNQLPSQQLLVQRIMNHIRENYCKSNLDANSIAAILNQTPQYMENVFENITGLSIDDYINNNRIDQVKELVSISHGLSLSEIASTCGYSDVQQLKKNFEVSTGQSLGTFANKQVLE